MPTVFPNPATPPGSNATNTSGGKSTSPSASSSHPTRCSKTASTKAVRSAPSRDRFAGGVLIDLPHQAVDERVKLTRTLIDDGAPAIFEASFLADKTFVAVDVLTPEGGGFHLTEVKSSSSEKEEHLPDVAVQIHVLEQSGIHITGVDVMHLNKECHFPDLSNLFERTRGSRWVERQFIRQLRRNWWSSRRN